MRYKSIAIVLLLIFMIYSAIDRNMGFITVVKTVTSLNMYDEISLNKNSKKDIDTMLHNIDKYIETNEFNKSLSDVDSIVAYSKTLVGEKSSMYDMIVYIYLHKQLLDRLQILQKEGLKIPQISIDKSIVTKALNNEKLIYKNMIENNNFSKEVREQYISSINSYMDRYIKAIENNDSSSIERELNRTNQSIKPYYKMIPLAFAEEMLKSIGIDKIIKLEYANNIKVSYLVLITLPAISNTSKVYHFILDKYEKFEFE